MRSLDRSRCPRCGERVTPFAAGCAICGADLDIRRFDRLQWWRPSHNPWLGRGALIAVAALLVYLVATRPDGPSQFARSGAPAAPAPAPARLPPDAVRVVAGVTAGAPPAAQRARLRRYLTARGVPAATIRAVMRHSRDGIGLVAAKGATATRVGGAGVVPAGVDWPRTPAGYPLDFIALIDFAQLPHVGPLPRAGRLALYYGGNPEDPLFGDPVASARAYYLAPGAPTASPKPPRETYPIAPSHLRGRAMSFAGDAEQVVESVATPAVRARLIKAMNDVTTAELQPSHLLGTPLAIQGPPLEELVHALGAPTGGVLPALRARYSRAQRRDPRQWLLLAQIEEQGGLTIADGGVLYYAIPRRDLAARRFDRVAVVMQSH